MKEGVTCLCGMRAPRFESRAKPAETNASGNQFPAGMTNRDQASTRRQHWEREATGSSTPPLSELPNTPTSPLQFNFLRNPTKQIETTTVERTIAKARSSQQRQFLPAVFLPATNPVAFLHSPITSHGSPPASMGPCMFLSSSLKSSQRDR